MGVMVSVHQRTHFGALPFQCITCKKAFNQIIYDYIHQLMQRSSHGNVVIALRDLERNKTKFITSSKKILTFYKLK